MSYLKLGIYNSSENNAIINKKKSKTLFLFFIFVTNRFDRNAQTWQLFFSVFHTIKSFHAFFFRIRQTFIKVEKVYRVIKVYMAQTIKHHVEKNCSTTTEFFSSFFNLLSFTQESSSKGGVILNELRFCDLKSDCLLVG